MNIGTFILRRILLAVPVLIGITLITFTISWEANGGDMARSYITPKMTPSQAAEVRLAHGFDQPFYVQYLTYVEGLLHGDLGISHTANDITVWQAFLVYFPATLELTLVAMIFAIVIGIFVGTLSAVHKDQPVDHATRFIALSGVSVPIFWLGLMLKYLFATRFAQNMIAQYGAPLEAFFFIVLFGAIVVVGLFMADGLDPVNTTWRSLTTSAIIAALVVVLLDAWLGWVFFAQIVLGITAIGVGGAVLLKVFRRRHLAGWQWWTALALAAVAAIGVTAVYGPVAVNNAFQEIPLLPLGGRFSDAIALGDHPADCARFNPIAQGCTGATGLLLVDSALAGDWALFNDAAMHLVLPGITLGYASLAIIARMMRGSMLETLNQDYIRTARAKGIAEREIIREHARRNALIPVTTVIGLSFGGLLGGAVLTETIFQWQGLGLWSTNAITAGDTNSVMGFVLFVVVVYLIANLVVDIVYSFLDPRVRLG